MAKFLQIVSIALVVFVGINSASPAKLQKVKSSQREVLARQEVDSDVPAQTPYPPAGIKPEIPFNLPTDEKLVAPVNYYLPPLDAEPAKFYSPPAEVYGPPAETYGPPELNVKDEVEEIAQDEPAQAEEESVDQDQPDDFQPEQSEESAVSQQSEDEQQANEAEPEETVPEAEPELEDRENKTLSERIVQGKNIGGKAAKLQVVPIRRQAAQPIYLGSLFAYNGQLYRL